MFVVYTVMAVVHMIYTMSLKFTILKKGIGIESQNVCKQFKDQTTTETRWNSNLMVVIEEKLILKHLLSLF